MKQFLTKKRMIVGAVVLAVALLAGLGVVYAASTWDQITHKQMDLFDQTHAPIPEDTEPPTATPEVTAPPSDTPTATDEPTGTVTPTPTVDPLTDLQNQADPNIGKDTLNILLVGVDYAGERTSWVKNFNSDVMLLLAINFKQKKVDMISFPRDTYAKIANVDGFYKLNFALTAGGGTNDKGFMNVCKSIEGILGDKRIPPVNYYIAVTMESVKALTDAIGGVDYNVDINFRIQGREYKKGMQHMTGQAVLDYCRVRKTAGTGYISEQPGDLNRVNRQKKMLVTVFKKLQKDATILTVPKILTSMKDNVFTNLNYKQLAALALFGKDLPDKKITMRTLQGYEKGDIFNYKFVLTYQDKRVQMLKEVYGVSVAPQYKYADSYARVQWASMQGEAWLKEIEKWRAKDDALLDKKKLINATENAKLDYYVRETQKLLTKYHSRLYSDSKPTFSKSEYSGFESTVAYLKKTADAMFLKAGYKADWHVNLHNPMNMIE